MSIRATLPASPLGLAPWMCGRSWVAILPVIAAMMLLAACGDGDGAAAIKPTYDGETGRLAGLAYDSDRNGRVDTWTDMDGAKPLQSRIDRNEDGKIDRWEHYDGSGGLVKVGFSRNDDGVADAWAFPGAGSALQRIEISSFGDEHRIDRWEYYDPSQSSADGDRGALVRVEEDSDADGRPDKWETYRSGAIETVAFDENRDGVSDRRLTYRNSALVLIESNPDPSGLFTTRTVVK